MATEKINIAEFQIDIEALTQAAAETASAINKIRDEQKQLVKDGKSTDQAFVRNQVNLRGLQKDYNAQLKVLDKYMQTTGKQVPLQQRIDAALRREAVTIDDLREQNKELTAIRNQVNITTEEGELQLIELNKQLDINNGLIKNNVSELEQQKISIGSYADGIREAIGDTGILNGQFGEISNTVKSFAPVFSDFGKQLKSVGTDFKNVAANTDGMSRSQKAAVIATNLTSTSLKALKLALIGTGIGAIVVLLGSFIAYLNSSEQASNRLGKILGSLGGIVSRLLDYLEPLGEFIMDVLVLGFEQLGKVADNTLKLVAAGLQALGFDDAAKSVNNFGEAMSDAAAKGEQLAEAEQRLAQMQRNAGIIQMQYQTEAEKLRQIRDDENRSIEERIDANERLGKTLQEQLRLEREVALAAVNAARMRAELNGLTAANADALAEANLNLLDIQERITGQESEQLTNRVSLQKEAAEQAKAAVEAAKAAAQARVDQMNDELTLFEAQQGVRARTIEQEIALEQELADRRKSILDEELKAKLISQTEYSTAIQNLENESAKRQAELAVQNLQREIDGIQDRIDIERAVSQAVGEAKIAEEERRFAELQEARARFAMIQFQQGVIDEQEYQYAVAEIRKNSSIQEANNAKARRELEKQARADQLELDLETQMLALESLHENEMEVRALQIEQDRERALEQARSRYTDEAMLAQAILNIEQQASNARLQLEREKNIAVWQSRADLAGALAQLLGEETLLGKAAAIAQATINTYVGVTQALASLPPPASWIAAATSLATGLSAVGQISGVTGNVGSASIPDYSGGTASEGQAMVALNAVPPFARGGKVKGGTRIKRSNGDNVLATLKTGEVVLTENHQRALGGDSVFKSLGVPGFATGGIVGGSTATVQNTIFSGLEDSLSSAIGEAVKEGARIGTEIGSNKGIKDLSTENYLRNLSSI